MTLPNTSGTLNTPKPPGKNSIGRPPMFKDQNRAGKVLAAFSEARRSDGYDCTLRELVNCAKKNFSLEDHSYGAIRQAVYRIVRARNIWLSRTRKAS